MNLDKVVAALLLLGNETPAFKALFAQVISTFKEADQNVLKRKYAEAILASDEQHKSAQSVPD